MFQFASVYYSSNVVQFRHTIENSLREKRIEMACTQTSSELSAYMICRTKGARSDLVGFLIRSVRLVEGRPSPPLMVSFFSAIDLVALAERDGI